MTEGVTNAEKLKKNVVTPKYLFLYKAFSLWYPFWLHPLLIMSRFL